jgi:transposase
VLFDNPKTVATGHIAGAAVLNPDLVRLAAHYRFSPRTTERQDPESKGKVEALVRFTKSDLIPYEGFGSLDPTLEDLYAQLRIIAIDEPLARQAGDLATQHALRGYDAVHLACALHLEGDDILLATWDNALNSAARATGQLIANDTG